MADVVGGKLGSDENNESLTAVSFIFARLKDLKSDFLNLESNLVGRLDALTSTLDLLCQRDASQKHYAGQAVDASMHDISIRVERLAKQMPLIDVSRIERNMSHMFA